MRTGPGNQTQDASHRQDNLLAPNDIGKNPNSADHDNKNCPPDLSLEAWENSKNQSWADDPKKRLAIRAFSRGILGAAFFVAGQKLASKWMQTTPYHAEASFLEQKNPLQVIAKLIDTVVGKPIAATVGAVAGKEAGLRSIHFRPTRYKTFGKEIMGRSLGDEVVNITFDFFCASVGDAWGRDIAGEGKLLADNLSALIFLPFPCNRRRTG